MTKIFVKYYISRSRIFKHVNGKCEVLDPAVLLSFLQICLRFLQREGKSKHRFQLLSLYPRFISLVYPLFCHTGQKRWPWQHAAALLWPPPPLLTLLLLFLSVLVVASFQAVLDVWVCATQVVVLRRWCVCCRRRVARVLLVPLRWNVCPVLVWVPPAFASFGRAVSL